MDEPKKIWRDISICAPFFLINPLEIQIASCCVPRNSVNRGTLVLRHSITHFAPNSERALSGRTQCYTFSQQQGEEMKILNISFLRHDWRACQNIYTLLYICTYLITIDSINTLTFRTKALIFL